MTEADAEIEAEAMAAASEVMAPPAGELEGRHDEASEEPWAPDAPTRDTAAESIPEESTAPALAEASEIPIEPAPQSTDEPRPTRLTTAARPRASQLRRATRAATIRLVTMPLATARRMTM